VTAPEEVHVALWLEDRKERGLRGGVENYIKLELQEVIWISGPGCWALVNLVMNTGVL
jgi:hypothetical protein